MKYFYTDYTIFDEDGKHYNHDHYPDCSSRVLYKTEGDFTRMSYNLGNTIMRVYKHAMCKEFISQDEFEKQVKWLEFRLENWQGDNENHIEFSNILKEIVKETISLAKNRWCRGEITTKQVQEEYFISHCISLNSDFVGTEQLFRVDGERKINSISETILQWDFPGMCADDFKFSILMCKLGIKALANAAKDNYKSRM